MPEPPAGPSAGSGRELLARRDPARIRAQIYWDVVPRFQRPDGRTLRREPRGKKCSPERRIVITAIAVHGMFSPVDVRGTLQGLTEDEAKSVGKFEMMHCKVKEYLQSSRTWVRAVEKLVRKQRALQEEQALAKKSSHQASAVEKPLIPLIRDIGHENYEVFDDSGRAARSDDRSTTNAVENGHLKQYSEQAVNS